MNSINPVVSEILGEEARHVAPLDSGNNDVFRVKTDKASYVLKCYARNRYMAYEREVGMRECLRQFSHIKYPSILGSAELSENRYILMEDVPGESLIEIWNQDSTRASKEMNVLGRMLGSLHEIPVVDAKHFLEREEVLFAENYFLWMVDTITPYLKAADQTSLLDKCYKTITSILVDEVVIHADFGPHQVIVDSQGQWILMDFEYAALGAFADDLAGTEVRLEQREYSNIDGFLIGYESVRGHLSEYELVRSAYKAYNLLAMLTYGISNRREVPSTGECERLSCLLESL